MKVHLNIIFSTGKFLYSYTNNKKTWQERVIYNRIFFQKNMEIYNSILWNIHKI